MCCAEKSLRAVRQTRSGRLTLSGGVSCNRERGDETLREACEENGIELLVAEPWLCTDNAANDCLCRDVATGSGIYLRISRRESTPILRSGKMASALADVLSTGWKSHATSILALEKVMARACKASAFR